MKRLTYSFWLSSLFKPDYSPRPVCLQVSRSLSTSTTIEYQLNKPSTVQLTIYDYLGKQVEVIEKKQAQRKQQIIWNAEVLPAGIYFCVIKTNQGSQTTKLIKL